MAPDNLPRYRMCSKAKHSKHCVILFPIIALMAGKHKPLSLPPSGAHLAFSQEFVLDGIARGNS
jgi:hypothetical protein